MQTDIFDLASPPRAPTAAAASAVSSQEVATEPAPPVVRLAEALMEVLPMETAFRTPVTAAAFGAKVLGLPYGSAAWSLDDVYDALEVAAHRVLLDGMGPLNAGDFRSRVESLREHETRLFHGRGLTEHARDLAQFSTPLPIAEGAALSIFVAPDVRTVREPCAGTGSLLRPLMRLEQLRLHPNELDARRRAALEWLGFTPTDRDALRLPLERERYDAILSNPPFGAMNRGHGGRGALPFAATNVAQRFTAAHFRSLRDGGLLVALLPSSTLSDAGAAFRQWLRDKHTPLLYLDCPVASYRSRGALRDTMLLVARAGQAGGAESPHIVSKPSWDTWLDALQHTACLLAPSAPQHSGEEDAVEAECLPVAVVPGTEPVEPMAAAPPHPSANPEVEVEPVLDPQSDQEAEPADEPAVEQAAEPAEESAVGQAAEPVAEAEEQAAAPDCAPQAQALQAPAAPGTEADDARAAPRPASTTEVAGDLATLLAEPDAVEIEILPTGDGASGELGSEARGAADGVCVQPDGSLGLDFGGPVVVDAPRAVADWDREAEERVQADASTVFAPFQVSLRERRAPHPRLVVETRSMAGMHAPPLIRQGFRSPLADDAWGRSGAHGGASDEQAELALRVLDAWDRGHGFLCADDVGVGKSREIVLLLLEAIEMGHSRILVSTKNENNVRDLEAEMRRVASCHESGSFPAQIVEVSNYRDAKGDRGVLPLPDGPTIYVAHSYNLADFKDALMRVGPTVWLADEAHEFSNIADSKRGLAWSEIHEAMLPNPEACFAYFTATPAGTLDQLSYLYGLRLWKVGTFAYWLAKKTGKRTADQDPEDEGTQSAIKAHLVAAASVGDSAGVDSDRAAEKRKKVFRASRNDAFTIRTTPAETEQVMRELKGSGHYLSRDLWRGGVTFEVEWVDILSDPQMRARYDVAAELCRDLSLAARQFGAMNEEVKTAGLDRAMIQGYLKQVLFDMRLDTVLARADAALALGRQVVISVHSVAGDEEDNVALGSDAQEHAVTKRLESAINRINVREIKKKRSAKGETSYLDLGEIPEALMVREELRERARALPRLRDPIRAIEQHFGVTQVASITGRVPARVRTQLMGEFQSGNRDVAVISRAGKVGISLHDVNRRRRTMLVADYEWSADLFKQELGRTDRTGQFSAPEIVLLASTAAGERKFAATIAARMASLGATCKGSAESTGTDALDQFDMSGGIALEAMKNTVQNLGDELRSFFTGSQFLERQKRDDGTSKWTPKKRPDESTQMRHFLLEMLMFPLQAANYTMALWEAERDKLLTDETLEAMAARRTGRFTGTVLRERDLPGLPPITLVDVENDEGEAKVIARGFVTEHMVRIQEARGPDANGNARTRRYVQFTSHEGHLISGLELSPSEAYRVRWSFGINEVREHTPETVLEDLRVGEKVGIQGPRSRWTLHLRRDGRIEIRGAKISSDRGALMAPAMEGVVKYEPAGNFLYLHPDGLPTFLETFSVIQGTAALAAAA